MRFFALIYIICCALPAVAQYAPQVGVAGSTAISRDDSRFVAWANSCAVERGWLDIADKPQGKVSLGVEQNGTGKADNYIVSLGDSGIAVLTFPGVIYNGPGTDFAVFENGFPNPGNPEEAFLEFAFVEVSSDGVNYVRFPASSLADTPQVPVAGVFMDARKVNNLAGKYIVNYGTPFDLEELKDSAGLDINYITHIRLVDVIGSLGAHSSLDKEGNKINDPYPSPVPGGGFDLDAVGALYMGGRWPTGLDNVAMDNSLQLYPNPARENISVRATGFSSGVLCIKDFAGRVLVRNRAGAQNSVDISRLANGVYYIVLNDENGKEWVGRFSKY